MLPEIDTRYPRWVYNNLYPKGRLVLSEPEFLTLEGAWFSHPDMREDSRLLGAPEVETTTAGEVEEAPRGKRK